ncbi:PHD and RING finger domain-containing protein 1-like protein [Dinothrombium tinctorium]|uniref:PHD and RING finger domain-containing protein 1-like protein n=1 Tax=Dinothrombium tinctorium TaxID=1965070 RepID=A0A3S3P5X0_9ACAR|nr:PHD and RING finger domain-containing protein 1-like protein [Dinothrombium tinctorium]
MAESKESNSGIWKKPSSNSKNRSYRDGKPKDARLLFRERESSKKETRERERSNNDGCGDNRHKKDSRRFRDDRRAEHPVDGRRDRHRHRRSPSPRKYDARDSKPFAKASRRESNDDALEKRSSKKHKCKHRRHEELGDDSLAVGSEDKIKKCRHSCHRHHRHHKKCKHRHHEEKLSSPLPQMQSEARTHSEHCSPSRMQKPSERIKCNVHSDITPLDSKEIYADGDKIFVNINFSKAASGVCDFSEVRNSDQSCEPIKENSAESNPPVSKPGEPPKKDVKLVSKSTTEFDIFWDDTSNEKRENSRKSSKTETEFDKLSANGCTFEHSPKKSETETFLSRNLNEVKGVTIDPNIPLVDTPLATTPPQTPPSGDDHKSINLSPDQTMPTPTQDESQLDSSKDESIGSINNNSINSPVSPVLNTDSRAKLQDIYDPEAPLESPSDDELNHGNRPEASRSNISPVKKQNSPVEKQKCETTKLKSASKTPTKTIKPPKSPSIEKHNAFSSQVTSTTTPTSSSALSNLMRLLPQPPVPPLQSAPPNSLLAQIQQTIIQQQKGTPQQQQQLNQIFQTASSVSSLFKNSTVSTSNQNLASSSKVSHTHDVNEVVDMEVDSPHSPPVPGQVSSGNKSSRSIATHSSTSILTNSNPSLKSVIDQLMKAAQTKQNSNHKISLSHGEVTSSANFKRPIPVNENLTSKHRGDMSSKSKHQSHSHHSSVKTKVTVPNETTKSLVKRHAVTAGGASVSSVKIGDVAVVDDVPSSAVELLVKEKYLKKLNRQERVVEEVKLVLKPFYQRREVTKEEYKEILRKSVPKICHSKTGEINPVKIKQLVEEYIKRMKHLRKKSKLKSGNSNVNVAKL